MYVISESEVARTINAITADKFMDALIDNIDKGFRMFDSAGAQLSARAGFTSGRNLIEWMPVHDGESNVTLKLVSYFPDNPVNHQAPTIDAVIVTFDFQTGKPKAVAGGALLTAMRTGAASAVASRILAKPDSRVLGLIGCGAQAVTQAHALSRIFKFEEILIHDTDPYAEETIDERLAFLGIKISPANVQEIEKRSDIICTATTNPVGSSPVLSGENLKRDVHINAVGADFPGKTELPGTLVKTAFVVTDFYEQAKVEGECQVFSGETPGADVCIELKDLAVARENYYGHQNRQTIFDSTGVALEDAIAVDLLCDIAKKYGIGKVLGDEMTTCALDPYSELLITSDCAMRSATRQRMETLS
ncbi:ornithine cyclodeaminase [Serratia quinivorans]|uniref:Ornithine cyclodeaminase n=2 Tax=Serratia TaxID=613 RepID=A0A380A0A7_9GAMM|nr:ornithine cyclodeaminase [Serratia quinivorans]SUI70684.1 ornithine cyclodeaminase [Serratia quinivorans]